MDVNIRDKRGEDAIVAVLGVAAAIIGGILFFGLIPGVLLTSIVNYFIYLTIGQLWGLSLILSGMVLFVIKNKYKDWQTSFKRYAIVATITGCILGLSALLIKYNFPVRTVMRMFNSQDGIPYKNLTAPSEISTNLIGEYGGEAYNVTYNLKGDVTVEIYNVNTNTDSVRASVTWTNGLDGHNKLSGTLKNKSLNLFSIPSDNDEDYDVVILGKVENGKIDCSYKIQWRTKKEVEEGNFKATNIKKQ